MDVICSEVRFVKISSPNECDKILKIPNEQTEPTDYMANCSKDDLTCLPFDLRIQCHAVIISDITDHNGIWEFNR